MPNTLTYCNGWAIHWSQWRDPANQDVRVGYWMARKGDDLKVSTTTGRVADTRELYAIDMTFMPGWPPVTSRTPEHEAERIKARALDALREALVA